MLDTAPGADVQRRMMQAQVIREILEDPGFEPAAVSIVLVQRLAENEVLDDVVGSFRQHSCKLIEVRFAKQARKDGRPELMGDFVPVEKRYGCLCKEKRSGIASHFGISGGGCFHVHGDIVQQRGIEKFSKHTGVRTVRVQLDGVSKTADACDEFGQVLMQRWFSSRDTDAVQSPPATSKEVEEGFDRQFGRVLCDMDELGVVAVWTGEVAADREHGGSELVRKVAERQRFVMCESHDLSPVDGETRFSAIWEHRRTASSAHESGGAMPNTFIVRCCAVS